MNANRSVNVLSNCRYRRLPTSLRTWQAFIEMKTRIDTLNECCPLLELMTNKSMKKRHWDRIGDLLKRPIDMENEEIRLRTMLDSDMLKFKDEIEDICVAASKEKDIEAKLRQLTLEWSSQEFAFSTFKARGELLLKGDRIAEVMVLLEESLITLSSLLNNRYNEPFKRQIQTFTKNLSDTGEILEQLMQVQNLWIYLEAVFVGGDIAKQLPKEARRFATIDKAWQR